METTKGWATGTGYHVRELNRAGQPVSCVSHPGPLEQAKLFAAQRLLKDCRAAEAEVCEVRVTAIGTETGTRVARVKHPTLGLFDTRQKYIMERRDADGVLDLRGPQPPFIECTADQIWAHYFAQTPGGAPSVSQAEVVAWYRERGWSWRAKTW